METALSRVFLTVSVLTTPALLFMMLEKARLNPTNPRFKLPYEVGIFTLGLCIMLPASVSIFP